MPNVTVYLPDDLHQYVQGQDLKLSALLQEQVRRHQAQHGELEQQFQTELEKYRNSSERRAEWERLEPGYPFNPCAVCGTGCDEAEGCLAMFEPYSAAAVAILAHEPDSLRRASLRAWAASGFKDVPLGPQ